MTPLKRRLAAVGAPLLLAVSLTACGGGAGGAPDDASEKNFCSAVVKAAPDGDDVDDIHTWADKMTDVGTPEAMSGEERAGFEKFADFAGDVSKDDAKKFESGTETKDLFGDDAKDVDAFTAYVGKTCADEINGE